jgi:hypothetical protein
MPTTYLSPAPAFKEHILEHAQVAVREILPPGVQDPQILTSVLPGAFEGLALELRGYVLRHKIDAGKHDVRVTFSYQVPDTWLDYIKEGLIRRWPKLGLRLRPKTRTVALAKYGKATCSLHNTFPESTIRYPKDLGRPVVFHTWG